MATIAFLGLGHMGGPMAANLIAAGHTVHGFDPVPAAAQAAREHGATTFDSGPEAVAGADVVITMGCGDACPIFPGKRYENWELPDPARQGLDAVRPIRDQIDQRIHQLLAQLNVPVTN